MSSLRKSIAYVREFGAYIGYTLRSSEYKNNLQKLEWLCPKGHPAIISFNRLQQDKGGCRECWKLRNGVTIRVSVDALVALAKARGFQYVETEEYRNCRQKLKWICSVGHPFLSTENQIQSGSGCPYCLRRDIDWARGLAEARGGKCLTEVFVDCKTKMLWGCWCGNVWEATADNIARGRWCAACSKNKKKDLEWARNLAKARGGEFLEDVYVNSQTKGWWRCGPGHEWEATPGSIAGGSWCYRCSLSDKTSAGENTIFDFVNSLYQDAVHGITGLLKTKKFQFDIWVPSLKKAIEFDGAYWHSLPGMKERDARKDVQCIDAGIALLRIKEADWKKDPEGCLVCIQKFLETGCLK